MSGVKGRSGRRVRSIQEKCYEVRDRARQVTLDALNDTSIPLVERAKIANPMVTKEIAQRIEQTIETVSLGQEDVKEFTEAKEGMTPIIDISKKSATP